MQQGQDGAFDGGDGHGHLQLPLVACRALGEQRDEVRASGARIRLINDGDVYGAIASAWPDAVFQTASAEKTWSVSSACRASSAPEAS